jgi:hypothetical protein
VQFFYGTDHGGDVIIKTSVTPAQGVDRIKNQALGNQFLQENIPNAPITIPQTTYFEAGHRSYAVMRTIPGEVVAACTPDGTCDGLTVADIATLVDWFVRVREIPTDRIPEHFFTVADTEWNETFYARRLVENAKEPLSQGFLTQDAFNTLKALWQRHYGTFSFQHHDCAPFNMIRKPDGTLALIDSEFSRIGMAGYDSAYFAIQTYCLYGRSDLASTILEETIKAWSEECPQDNLLTTILAALAYRIVANFADDSTRHNQNVLTRTIHLSTLIQSGNIDRIISGLRP